MWTTAERHLAAAALVALIGILTLPSSALAQVSVRSVGTNSGAAEGATTCTVQKPTGLTAGDLMVAVVGQRVATVTLTPPDGSWASIRQNTQSTTLTLESFWKIADSGDAAASTFVWTSTGSNSFVCGIYAVTGYNTSSPIATSNGGGNAAGTSGVSPGVTPTTAESLLIFGAIINDDDYCGTPTCSSGFTGPTLATDDISWTQGWQYGQISGADASGISFYGVRTPTTATGNASGSWTNSDSSVMQLVVINPAPSATAPGRLLLLGVSQ